MKKLTIIIPFLNEGEEPINTINSIYQTTNKDDFEIILIDDASTDNQDLNRFDIFDNVKYFRNEIRRGTGYCISLGVNNAESPNILIIDAHMRFLNDDWLNKIVNELEKDDKLLMCTISLTLNYNNKDKWDINKPFHEIKNFHSGADLLPYYQLNDNFKVLLDPRWKDLDKTKEYLHDIHCVMGACYASSTKWMKHIKNTEGLKMWGSIEETLSLKTWLAGGSVKLLTTTGIGHIFRNIDVPYEVDVDHHLYNKLWLIYTIFDDKTVYNMFKFIDNDPRYIIPMKILNENIVEAKKHKDYFKKIFTRDVKFLESIGITFNQEIYTIVLSIKEQIKELNDILKLRNKKLLKYKSTLEKLELDKTINERKKIMCKKQLIDDFIPQSESEVKEIEDKINLLTIELNKIKPEISAFGYDI